MRTAILVSLLAAALPHWTTPALGQEPARDERFAGATQVTAVEIVVEVAGPDGRPPGNLSPSDFSITEDGQPVQIVGVEAFRTGGIGAEPDSPGSHPHAPLGRGDQGAWDWRLVVWFDQELSSSRSIRRAAESLAAQAGALTRLGTVEIVVAGGERKMTLQRTRSAPLVEQTLLELARNTAGRDQLRQIRRQYLSTLQLQGQLDSRNQANATLARLMPEVSQREQGAEFSRKSVIRESASAERMLIDRRLDLLVSFISLNAEPAPKALILVSDGWDIDPRDFYLVGMPDRAEFGMELTAILEISDGGSAFDGMARHLSTTGWTSLSIATGAMEAGSAMAAEHSGAGRLGEINSGGEETISEIPMRLVMKPNEPLYALAEATGGEALTGVRELPSALGRLADRVRLTYQVSRPPDARSRKVEVKSTRTGVKVHAPAWAGIPAGEAIASSRARNLLAGDPLQSDLRLEAAIGLRQETGTDSKRVKGELQARIDLTPIRAALADSSDSDLRATIAVSAPEAAPFVHHATIPKQRLAGLTAWTYSLPIDLPRGFERVAVVLEESSTGAWGAGLASIVEGPLPSIHRPSARVSEAEDVASESVEDDPQAVLDLLPARKPLLLVPPESDPAVGRVRFEPLVAGLEVARVDYLLDGSSVASSDRPPFDVAIDLGDVPVARELEALARNAAGVEIGRDTLTLNAGVGTFAVRLIEPRNREHVGPVDVEAEVTLPGRKLEELDRVELFWNDRRVATLFAPPFRQRILIPAESPAGFITAVAHRRDGTSVEDVLMMNDAGGAESLDVRLVELAATVVDGAGRPVQGLAAGDFELVEGAARQTLDAVRDGRELPLTLGLALDSSGSMFEEMTAVKSAAIDFLALTLDPADRAFVVDFDSEARVAVELTGDLRALGEGIAEIRPGGSTALCDALVYSLARLQRVRGRRALVVLSDGLGRDERVSFAACQRFVARSGVPVYLIMLPEEGPADPRRSETAARRAEELVGASGGRVLRIESIARLGQVYLEIQGELRAQYVLSYYPSADAESEPGWRPVTIGTTRPGLSVRAARGYYR